MKHFHEALAAIVRNCPDFQIIGDSLSFVGDKNLSDIFQNLEEVIQREHYIDLAYGEQEDWEDVIEVAQQRSDHSTWTDPILIKDLFRLTLYRVYRSYPVINGRVDQQKISRTEFEQEVTHVEEMFQKIQDHYTTLDSQYRNLAKEGVVVARKQKQQEEFIEFLEAVTGQTRDDLDSFKTTVQKKIRKLEDCVTNLCDLCGSFETIKFGYETFIKRLDKLDRSLFRLNLLVLLQREFLGVTYGGRIAEERPPPYRSRLRGDAIQTFRTATDATFEQDMLWEAEAHVSGAVEVRDQEAKAVGKECTEIPMCPELAEEDGMQEFSTQDAEGEIRDESDSLQCELERAKQKSQYGESKTLATVTNVVSCAKKATEEGMSTTSSATGKFAKARSARFIKLEQQVPSVEVAIRRRLSKSGAFRFLQELGIEWALRVFILLVGGYIRWSTHSQSLYTRGVKVLLCLSLFGIFAGLHQVVRQTLTTNLGNQLPLSSAYEGAPIELNIYGADIYG